MKQYNGEKAIISLTSWKGRIDTVSKTIYSLLKQCPGFHIVLVLSEEEFPKKELELPENLKLFIDTDLIEILWVYKNYKAFKKVIFTMDKYRNVPVIGADDDYIYTCNYAEKLYQTWLKNKNAVIRYSGSVTRWDLAVASACTLFSYESIGKYIMKVFSKMTDKDFKESRDDNFYNEIIKHFKLRIISCNKGKYMYIHTAKKSLHPNPWWLNGGTAPAPKKHFSHLFK